MVYFCLVLLALCSVPITIVSSFPNSFAFSKNCVGSECVLYIVTTVEGIYVGRAEVDAPICPEASTEFKFPPNCEIINSHGMNGYVFQNQKWAPVDYLMG